jgi:ribonucleoside-diphosphate reductase alpha chain
MADSISDLISKIIDIELGDFTYCQIKPLASIPIPAALPKQSLSKIYGETCPSCKSERLVKNGTCKVCIECGTTTGCS